MSFSTGMRIGVMALAVAGSWSCGNPGEAKEGQRVEDAPAQVLSPAENLRRGKMAVDNGVLHIAREHFEALPDGPDKRRALAKLKKLEDKAEKEDPGPMPTPQVMAIALRSRLLDVAHDPDSVGEVDIGEISKASVRIDGKVVYCWKVPFSFRARNGFGALRLHHGSVWMKDNQSIKESIQG